MSLAERFIQTINIFNCWQSWESSGFVCMHILF